MINRLATVVAVAFVICLTMYGLYQDEMERSHIITGEIVVDIHRGDSVRAISRKLDDAGVISGWWLFTLEAKITGTEGKIRAGEYLLKRGLSIRDAIKTLVEGKTLLSNVTIPEGYTAKQIAAELEKAGLVSAADFMAVVSDRRFLDKWSIDANNAEGFIFPDTYHLTKGMGAKEIAGVMVKTFFTKIKPVIPDEVAANPKELHRIITLASLVEKETAVKEERKKVAAVFLNRLARGMLLQCDPTVIYGLPDYNGTLHKKDLAHDSPYNTYKYPGLPPGPIANPGLASIDAAYRPAQSKYLYFVAKNNGEHYFSTDLEEHNKAVRRYHLAQAGAGEK